MSFRLSDQRLQHRADSRRAILEAAEELLVEGGLESFSMRRLAERCGCTAPTLYHYFRDKPGLVDALLEERLRELLAELRETQLPGDALGKVRVLCAAFARFGVRNPAHYQLLVTKRDAPGPPSREELERLLLDPLEGLVRRGALAEERLETVRQGLWSLLHGFILLQTTRPDEDWRPGLLESSLDAMLRGWLGERAA
jgi:AcrR family transcriptional regulator